jgi:hypothetical protein
LGTKLTITKNFVVYDNVSAAFKAYLK